MMRWAAGPPVTLPAALDVPGEAVQDGLPPGPLLLGGVRLFRVERLPDGDAAAGRDELHGQGAVAEGALDQLVGDDLRVRPGEVEPRAPVPGLHPRGEPAADPQIDRG